MSSSRSKSESSVELRRLRDRIQNLLSGNHEKHGGRTNGIKEALKVARRIAIRSAKSRNFKRALDKAYERVTSKSGSTPFTRLAKYLFPGRDSTSINLYARVLAVADDLGWSPSDLRAHLADASISKIANRFKSKAASKRPRFDWDDVKRTLDKYGSFRTDIARTRWRVALVHFSSSGKSSVYRLPVSVRTSAEALARRACKAKSGPSPSKK